MIFKIFATIVAFIMGFLGLHQQLPQPTTPTTQVTRTVQPEASGKPAQPTSTSATGDIDPDSASTTADGAVGSAEWFTPGNRCGNAKTHHPPVGFHQPADLPGQ